MEYQLTQKFKRIVIRGKRGCGVPIMFTPNLQKVIKLLLGIRAVTTFIDPNNPYLFALPHAMTCLRGSDAIRKFANECGAKNPENLTSTRLRKQVATVAQLLNLTENDMNQLSTFLGHSKDVHKSFYRLPESTFQVAKICKVLLMMEKGRGEEFRGKNLDEININIDSLISDEENDGNLSKDDDRINENNEKLKTTEEKAAAKKIVNHSKSNYNKNKSDLKSKVKPKCNRVPWTDEERQTALRYFNKPIILKKASKKEECEDLKIQNPHLFLNKTWQEIKTFIHYMYQIR